MDWELNKKATIVITDWRLASEAGFLVNSLS